MPDVFKRSVPLFLLLVFWMQFSCVVAQRYQVTQYASDKVGTEMIKSIAQDSIGNIWIGSDDGLLRYDGITFHQYQNVTQSNYIKSLYKNEKGEIWVLDDLGVGIIHTSEDSVWVKPVLYGARLPESGKIWYPKLMHEKKNAYWFSEPGAISKLENGELRRYMFHSEDITTSFIKSFNFIELEEAMLVSSQRGSFFKYNAELDQFDKVKTNRKIKEINHVLKVGDQWLVAAYSGIYSLHYNSIKNTVELKLLQGIDHPSFICEVKKNTLLVATLTGTLHLLQKQNNDWLVSQIPGDFSVAYTIYMAADESIWVSTESGLFLLSEQSFFPPVAAHQGEFIQSITENYNLGKFYYCTRTDVLAIDYAKGNTTTIVKDLDAFFLSLRSIPKGLWIADANQLVFKGYDGVKKRFAFGGRENIIFDVEKDAENNIWAAPESIPQLIFMDTLFQSKLFTKEQGIDKEMNVVRVKDNSVYAGGLSTGHYLYVKAAQDSIFTNISIAPNFETSQDLEVNDLDFQDSIIWLGTSKGLLRYDHTTLSRVNNIPEFQFSVGNVEVDPVTNAIWFTNHRGLFYYDPKDESYTVFNESTGLSSNTVNGRGLFIDSENSVWLSLSRGLVKSVDGIRVFKKTPTPSLLHSTLNGVNKPDLLSKMTEGEELSFTFISHVYPTDNIHYYYEIKNANRLLKKGTMSNSVFTVPPLFAGEYQLNVYAQKVGRFRKSEAFSHSFSIRKPYYKTFWFGMVMLIVLLVLVFITRFVTLLIQKKREQALERQVLERTKALQQANTELEERNKELDQFVYSASHDLSAPLKSIRGLANIGRLDTVSPSQLDIFDKITESVSKLESFIKDVINYSRNARLQVVIKPIAVLKLTQSVINDLSYSENFKKLFIDVQIDPQLSLLADETSLKIILNNLISNAIKFQDKNKDKPTVIIRCFDTSEGYTLEVEDNGCGIKEEYQKKVFDMFFRGSYDSDGSGLGLYILKEAVQKMDGFIHLNSTIGQGTTFTINFPFSAV